MTAAAAVLEQYGYAAVTTELIAQTAGVSIGSLYRYFPDKDALLVALFEEHLDRIGRHFSELGAKLEARAPLGVVVREMVARLFAIHRARGRLQRILVETAPATHDLIRDYETLRRRLRAAWARYLRDTVVDPDLVAATIIDVVETMAQRYAEFPPRDRPVDELETALITMAVAHVRAQQR